MAQYLVDFTRAAEREIEQIKEWIAVDSLEASGRWVDGLLAVVDRLERMPFRCPLAPENESHAEEIRQMIYGGRNEKRCVATPAGSTGIALACITSKS